MRKLVSNFRTQADQQRSIATNCKKELETTRKLLLDTLKKAEPVSAVFMLTVGTRKTVLTLEFPSSEAWLVLGA